MKKKSTLMSVLLTSIVFAGCSKDQKNQDVKKPELNDTTIEDVQESTQNDNAQTEQQKTSDDKDLLDQFLAGEVNAYRTSTDEEGVSQSSDFNISDLPMDEKEWDSYKIGNRMDLDNDGEDELILDGPYGGMYLDSLKDKVIVFASGEGTADNLSYTNFDNNVWIVHSDTMHTGRTYYKLDQYSGADHVTDSVILYMEEEAGDKTYYINDRKVSEARYLEVYEKFFGEE